MGKVFDACVRPVMMYCLKKCALTNSIEADLQKADRKMMRLWQRPAGRTG